MKSLVNLVLKLDHIIFGFQEEYRSRCVAWSNTWMNMFGIAIEYTIDAYFSQFDVSWNISVISYSFLFY